MKIVHQRRKKDCSVAIAKSNRLRVGFVPTMGALHEGHLALVKKALQENHRVIVSIFVNPTQFDNRNDLETYPRTLESDRAQLRYIDPNIIVFAPKPEALYGQHMISRPYNFGTLAQGMEARYRKGHFDGVGTVLYHFFKLLKPEQAYFGEKDFQQLQIVKKMVELESLNVSIVGCPIYREPNGLAMSSRNQRLSAKAREEAALIHKTLSWVQFHFGTKSVLDLRDEVHRVFEQQADFDLEYFEIADQNTLLPITKSKPKGHYRAFIAARIEGVRLIDNIAL